MRWGAKGLCIAGFGLFLTACGTVPFKQPAEAPAAADVAISRDHDRWTAEYKFSSDAPVWVFQHSSLEMRTRTPWRLKQWHSETPGVVLEHIGDWDVLRATNGSNVPRHVRLGLTPQPVLLEADYPTLSFSDGSVGLYSGAFDLFPVASPDAVKKLPGDLNDYPMPVGTVRTHWHDAAGPVLANGRRVREASAEDDDLYVLFGQTPANESARLTTVSDPALPTWLSASLNDFAPRTVDYYATRLGPGQTAHPTVMITWMGPTPHKLSLGGSVLPGLIIMTLEGEGLTSPSPRATTQNQWFIAHESAHFWLGQMVHYNSSLDSWITEGGADLMAVRALQAFDPTYDAKADLQNEVDDCLKLARRPVSDAGSRGEHRAWYACGASFAMIAEAGQKQASGGDWFDFIKPLIDAHRQDHVLTRADWLARLTKISGDPTLARDMTEVLDNGIADPAVTMASLFDRAHIAYRRDGDRIVLQ